MTDKTHYRRVFKSDHLGVADLEDMIESGRRDLIFTIREVRQEMGVKVAGKKGDHNIAYFEERIKPWVINAYNGKVLKNITGSSFVEDWRGLRIRLYIDPNVKFAGDITGGIRIDPNLPRRAEVTPENEKLWNNAIAAFRRDGNFEKVLAKADISAENQEKIRRAVSA